MSDNLDNIDKLNEPLFTDDGYLNKAAINELEAYIKNSPKPYERNDGDREWTKKHWVFIKDITSYLAKWAISQSPYTYPENLDVVVKYLSACLKRYAESRKEKEVAKFSNDYMIFISLNNINKMLYEILYEQGVETFDNWNKPKNKSASDITFVSRDSCPEPDNDSIDLDALLNNVCISLRDKFRAEAIFDRKFKKDMKKWRKDEHGKGNGKA